MTSASDTGAPPDSSEIRQLIRDAGLRATAGRIAVAECLIAAACPLTHGEVVDRLGPRGFDRASIYRNLVDLTSAGLCTRTDLGDHVWRFVMRPGTSDEHFVDHPHFVCSSCGQVQCLESVQVTLKSLRGAPRAIRTRNVEIHVRGLCDRCGGD